MLKSFLIKLVFKSIKLEDISRITAKCIVWLLEYARNKGDKYWDTAKGVIRKINNWCSLFLEVYEDDELTEEDEIKIAEAIANETDVKTIAKILQDKLNNKKLLAASQKKTKTKKRRSAKAEKKEVKRVAQRLEESSPKGAK